MDAAKPKPGGRGRRALAALCLAGIAVALGGLVREGVLLANRRAEIRLLTREAHRLLDALDRFHATNGRYPNAWVEPRLDPGSLDLLRRRGYYDGAILERLVEGRLDGYDSPDDRGLNQEFWLEMTSRRDPSVRLLVARSDEAPLGEGRYREGVFLYRDGTLEAR